MIQDRLDPVTVASLLQLVANRAPHFMRNAGFQHDDNDRAEVVRVDADERAEIIRRYDEQRNQGRSDFMEIARAMGRTSACIGKIARAHRKDRKP